MLPADIVLAAERGDLMTVCRVLDEGHLDVNARSRFQSTLVLIASAYGHIEMVRALAARGADVNALDYGNARRTALSHAIRRGHVAMVEALLEVGADPSLRSLPDERQRRLEEIGAVGDVEQDDREELQAAFQLMLNEGRVWCPERHRLYPSKFRHAVRFLLSCAMINTKSTGVNDDDSAPCAEKIRQREECKCRCGSGWALGLDETMEVVRRMAYPLSLWIDKSPD